ncbi:family 78 glycoside hydrolase catalytic domain [Neorhodopirellula pilleata]|uniref:alpha-L-rhamnosidase n=1 Tax=Neorhodopirellula pilleata TaxID=2714738 RepID=A0A5C6ABB4_9BACT|nr:family 78 glycoside hydrolase catalytic domain [Neorhodopirellula pilleata]TWT97332.1 Bacterial alpha-L-rhamnosidase [Neorhodopirellula pilleata]
MRLESFGWLLASLWFVCPAIGQEGLALSSHRNAESQDNTDGMESMLSRGYTPLFNGADLTGWWNPYPYGEAKVIDGEIHLRADKKFFLVTERKYADFRVSVEIHLPEGPANSGVMFRCHVDENAQKKVFGYQAECDGSDRKWSGGLYDEARRGWVWPSTSGRSIEPFLEHEAESKAAFADPVIANALNRHGWNRFDITCIEDRISIEVNGVPTCSFRDTADAYGYIAIQHHGEKGQTYRFRNLFIKELPQVPAEDTVSIVEQAPVAVTKIDDQVTLVDFGKVAFGNIAMRIPRSGRGNGKLHFGEKLKNGRIDREPPGTVRYGVSDFRKGSGQIGTWIVPAPVDVRNTEQAGATGDHPPAVLTPRSWLPVMPFRWVEVEGWDGDFQPEYISRRAAFASNWNDDASSFECSNELLNEIWELCKYSIKATTFAGVYVDGDRERIPYEADAYLNQLSHYYTDDDVEMAAKTFDWLMEHGTWPTEWAPHMVFMAHAEWMQSGNDEWLSHRYESLKTKTLLHRSGEDGLIRSDELDRKRHDIVDWPQKERDGFVFTELNVVVNAFHIEALRQMAEMADGLGKSGDAQAFRDRLNLARTSFQTTFFDESTGIYRDGVGTNHSSLHANLFPLAFGIVPDEKEAGVVAWLRKQSMRCSPYAAQYFLEGLFRHGSDQKALDLIVAEGDRSWKHMVDSGTTITWEAWDLKYKPNQDWNHAWGAAPANLLPRFVLGVEPKHPGWTSATISPQPGELKYARGRVPTKLGPIVVDWTNQSTFKLSLALPDGVKATVDVPAAVGTTGVLIDGKPAVATKVRDRWVITEALVGDVVIETK